MGSKLGAVFAENLRRRRQVCGLTQAELADKINTTPGHIGHLERQEREPSFSTIERICAALQVTPASLFLQSGGPDTLEKELESLFAFLSGRTAEEVRMIGYLAGQILRNTSLSIQIREPSK